MYDDDDRHWCRQQDRDAWATQTRRFSFSTRSRSCSSTESVNTPKNVHLTLQVKWILFKIIKTCVWALPFVSDYCFWTVFSSQIQWTMRGTRQRQPGRSLTVKSSKKERSHFLSVPVEMPQTSPGVWRKYIMTCMEEDRCVREKLPELHKDVRLKQVIKTK